MSNKIVWLFAGDLHKRAKDITTIQGYVDCCNAVQRGIMNIIDEEGVTHFGSLGDWFDSGYTSDVNVALSHYDIDIEMAKQLNGNFFGVIGNHIRLNLDSNPELMLIQPHPTIKPRAKVYRDEQVIKTPDYLLFGDELQISFMHHIPNVHDVLEYKPKRLPNIKYHIALFHTPLIIPNSQLMKTTLKTHINSDSKIGQVLDGVDLAICGDIHKPLGSFMVNNTRMIVPGSLTNTDASDANRHSSIALPKVTYDLDSREVLVEFVIFDLKLNLVTFKQKIKSVDKKKLSTLKGNLVEKFNIAADFEEETSSVLADGLSGISLNSFLQSNGYTDSDKRLLSAVLSRPEDILDMVRIHTKKDEVDLI